MLASDFIAYSGCLSISSRASEITELDMAVVIHEEIVTSHIPMHDPLFV
jgi:hypothetical protein